MNKAIVKPSFIELKRPEDLIRNKVKEAQLKHQF